MPKYGDLPSHFSCGFSIQCAGMGGLFCAEDPPDLCHWNVLSLIRPPESRRGVGPPVPFLSLSLHHVAPNPHAPVCRCSAGRPVGPTSFGLGGSAADPRDGFATLSTTPFMSAWVRIFWGVVENSPPTYSGIGIYELPKCPKNGAFFWLFSLFSLFLINEHF